MSPGRGLIGRARVKARWPEYRSLLRAALAAGYSLPSLEDWVLGPGTPGERVLLLRHDVDQHPASALAMAAIEREVGATSTWYVRWRTAHPTVISHLKDAGHHVGLHYETLTRHALACGLWPAAGGRRFRPRAVPG